MSCYLLKTSVVRVSLVLVAASPQFCFAETSVTPGPAAAAVKAFNPDTSVNFLGFYRKSNINTGDLIGRSSDVHNGFNFQEAEIQFFADVDPYLRANALFSIGPEANKFGIDPEEVFLETTSLPVVSLKAGKFKAALGKHNTLHTHAFPFIDAPLINQDLLGPEGLNETGISAATLVPAPWFFEITAQALSNSNTTLYNSPNSGDATGVAQVRNLWDLSDETTMEWSVYGTLGKNAALRNASVLGSDLIFKWRPSVGGKYHGLIFANEYLNGQSPGPGFLVGPTAAPSIGARLGGLASWLQYQFAERWWIQGRTEFEGIPRSSNLPNRHKQSALLGFFPSEFSGFRVQYDHLMADNQATENAVTVQWNITIGAHPAHSY